MHSRGKERLVATESLAAANSRCRIVIGVAPGESTHERNRHKPSFRARIDELIRAASRWVAGRIPARAWAVLGELRRQVSDDRVTGLAAEIAFFAILSVFPGLIMFAAALGSLELLIGGSVAEEAQRLVIDFMRRVLTEQASPAIEVASDLFAEERGGIITVSLVASFWALTRGFTAVVRALNLAYDIEEARSWLRQRLVAALLSLGSVIVGALMLAVFVAGPMLGGGRAIATTLGLGGAFGWVWAVLRWPLAFAFVVLWAAAVYHFGPNRKSRLSEELPGAVLTAVLGVAASAGLSVYLRVAASTNPVLGSLGGGLILLIWLYLLNLGLLVGGELNAVLTFKQWRGRATTHR